MRRFGVFAAAATVFGAVIASGAVNVADAAPAAATTGCYRPTLSRPAGNRLTPQRIQFEVATMFDAVYREGWMKPDAICYVFENVEILPDRMRKLGAGFYDQPVRVSPVRMTVRVRINRGRNGIDERVRGYGNLNTPRETFYFYQEDGNWNFKTGNP